jgi:hypothetical protein
VGLSGLPHRVDKFGHCSALLLFRVALEIGLQLPGSACSSSTGRPAMLGCCHLALRPPRPAEPDIADRTSVDVSSRSDRGRR